MSAKLCERCHDRLAKVRLTVLGEAEGRVEYVCEECAKTAGLEMGAVQEELGLESQNQEGEPRQSALEDPVSCSRCGLTFARFKERYRLGCADCVDAFRPLLQPILRKVHGAERHTGKRFARLMEDESDAGMPKGTWMLELLKRRLQAAVDREEFEEAARLRDRIESIKREQGGESGAE